MQELASLRIGDVVYGMSLATYSARIPLDMPGGSLRCSTTNAAIASEPFSWALAPAGRGILQDLVPVGRRILQDLFSPSQSPMLFHSSMY